MARVAEARRRSTRAQRCATKPSASLLSAPTSSASAAAAEAAAVVEASASFPAAAAAAAAFSSADPDASVSAAASAAMRHAVRRSGETTSACAVRDASEATASAVTWRGLRSEITSGLRLGWSSLKPHA
eukprot:scaffold15235_cov61-Phaeocystis_antarctica.AAC.2